MFNKQIEVTHWSHYEQNFALYGLAMCVNGCMRVHIKHFLRHTLTEILCITFEDPRTAFWLNVQQLGKVQMDRLTVQQVTTKHIM